MGGKERYSLEEMFRILRKKMEEIEQETPEEAEEALERSSWEQVMEIWKWKRGNPK